MCSLMEVSGPVDTSVRLQEWRPAGRAGPSSLSCPMCLRQGPDRTSSGGVSVLFGRGRTDTPPEVTCSTGADAVARLHAEPCPADAVTSAGRTCPVRAARLLAAWRSARRAPLGRHPEPRGLDAATRAPAFALTVRRTIAWGVRSDETRETDLTAPDLTRCQSTVPGHVRFTGSVIQ